MNAIVDVNGQPFPDSTNDVFSDQGWDSFTFGEPTPVMGGRDLLDYTQAFNNGRYYEPPVSLKGLHRSLGASPHHSSGIYVKRNILTTTLVNPLPNTGAFVERNKKRLSPLQFEQLALDQALLNNAYIRRIESRTGKLHSWEVLPAMYTRKMIKGNNRYCYIEKLNNIIEYEEDEVFHLYSRDSAQEIYGLPEYLSGLQSAWLNESATIFRRRYYENGSHAGFILYMTDTAHKEDDINNLRKSLKESKGPGNFRNLFMYAPGGKKDGLTIVPISEVTAKDEFLNIKSVSRDDVMAAHRVPPELMSIIPSNTGGLGNPELAAKVFFRNEVRPLQMRWESLNEWAGETVVEFEEYAI